MVQLAQSKMSQTGKFQDKSLTFAVSRKSLETRNQNLGSSPNLHVGFMTQRPTHTQDQMVKFNYETKNLRLRSQQKQMNRHLTSTSDRAGSANSKASKCSTCVHVQNRKEICDRCNVLKQRSLNDDYQTLIQKKYQTKSTPGFNLQRVAWQGHEVFKKLRNAIGGSLNHSPSDNLTQE